MDALILQKIYFEAPVGCCRRSALVLLNYLARRRDEPAILALSHIVAHELGYGSDANWATLESDYERHARHDTSPVVLLYSIPFRPYEFSKNRSLWVQSAEAIDQKDLLQRVRYLIELSSPLQHEALKIYLLHIAATTSKGPDGKVDISGLRLASRILDSAEVKPGNTADSDFHFGRDLLLHCSDDMLLIAILHEMAHVTGLPSTLDESREPPKDDLPELITLLQENLGSIIDPARARVGTSDTRAMTLLSRRKLMCTYHELEGEAYLHISTSNDGGAIELQDGTRLAHLTLSALGLDTSPTAIAYSPRGIVHVGTRTSLLTVESLGARLNRIDIAHLASAETHASDEWLWRVVALSGLGWRESDPQVALGLTRSPIHIVSLNEHSALNEHKICSQLHTGTDFQHVDVDSGYKLLRIAIRCGALEPIEALLSFVNPISLDLGELGFSMSILDDGFNSQYLGPQPEAIRRIIELCHSSGFDLDAALDANETTLLHQSCANASVLADLLISKGANPNLRDVSGRTPLHFACLLGSNADVDRLLRAGAQICGNVSTSGSPLHIAVRRGRMEMVRLLLEVGADSNCLDSFGRTPAMITQEPDLIRLLHANGADLDLAEHNGTTPLISAATATNVAVVHLLLSLGADPNACTDKGWTALHCCFLNDGKINPQDMGSFTAMICSYRPPNLEARLACIKLLLGHQADLEDETKDGWTALMLAVAANDKLATRCLLEAGASAEQTNKHGLSAADWAQYDRTDPAIRDAILGRQETDA